MKRSSAFLLALTLLLTFSGCGEAEEQDRGFDSMRSFTRYSPMVRAAETPDTIYFMAWSDAYLKCVDKASGISSVLCGKPECRHNDPNCNGYVGYYVWDIFVDGGRLYWVSGATNGFLYSAALDGTDRRKEAELQEEMIPNNWKGDRHCVLHDGWLYFYVRSTEIVDGEEKYYNHVAAFPVNAREEPFTILNEETSPNGCLSAQLYGNFLYILTSEESALSKDETTLYDCKLRRWDVASGEFETLYQDEGSSLYYSTDLWVTDENVFFNRETANVPLEEQETKIYRYDFDTGECKFIFDTGLHGWSDPGVIADDLVTGYEIRTNDNGIYDFYVMIKDFEGNVLVDETYTLDIRDGYTHYGRLEGLDGISYNVDLLGRDEEYAYYSFYAQDLTNEGYTTYISIIPVALDGSGARVVCTQSENIVYGR